jgi:hypothetical protein
MAKIENLYSKMILSSGRALMYIQLAVMSVVLLGAVCTYAQLSTLASNVLSPICTIYSAVQEVVFVLGLTLLVLGAALYAGGNIAPGDVKGKIQGYGLGMIMGGIVGVILSIIAPWILSMISSGATSTQNVIGICQQTPAG